MSGRAVTIPPLVEAAGGVLWRMNGDQREVALVHRPRYDDWSVPKGKRKAGESLLLTAAREVEEETGQSSRIGAPVGRYWYLVTVGGSRVSKQVAYWSMAAGGGSFTPDDEVDDVQWSGIDEAIARASSLVDRKVLTAYAAAPATTTTVLVLGDDDAGAVDPAVLECLRVTRLIASDAPACSSALEAYAARTGLVVEIDAGLTAATFGTAGSDVRRIITAASEGGAVAVSVDAATVAPLVSALAPAITPRPGLAAPCLLHLTDDEVFAIQRSELLP